MGHVEAIREKLVVNVLRRFLQGNDMPPSCNLLIEGIFFSPTVSRVPVVDAEPLHNRTGRKAFTGTVHVRRGGVFSFRCLAKICCSLLNIHQMLEQDFVVAHFDPWSKKICSWVVKFFVTGQDYLIWKRQHQTLRKGTELTWMNEVAFRPWPQRRQWCLNSLPKNKLYLEASWSPKVAKWNAPKSWESQGCIHCELCYGS